VLSRLLEQQGSQGRLKMLVQLRAIVSIVGLSEISDSPLFAQLRLSQRSYWESCANRRLADELVTELHESVDIPSRSQVVLTVNNY
jgi:hypothetical protein